MNKFIRLNDKRRNKKVEMSIKTRLEFVKENEDIYNIGEYIINYNIENSIVYYDYKLAV